MNEIEVENSEEMVNDEETWQDICKKMLVNERVGLDDMTELEHVDDQNIAENLRIRLLEEQIYTCIGRVLIAVNPFKKLEIYDKSYVAAYHNFLEAKHTKKKAQNLKRSDTLKCSTAKLPSLVQCSEETNNEQDSGVDLPPHIYALTDNMYRNMMIERENQCVIISGESGAGKTISAKYIMSYLSEVASGGTQNIEEIKNIIIQSNPLLEAFGNAKTLRNNNSSRFGKFVEILFNMSGQPDGGRISNFLLEKSRVVSQNPGERNYHVFYQLLRGSTENQKENLGLQESDPAEYYYLNRTGGVYDVPDADDVEEFQATMNAMNVVGLSSELQDNVLGIISAILHLGNIHFVEDNNVAEVDNPEGLIVPAQLLGVDKDALKEKLVSRLMEARWGGKVDVMMMTLNVEQANVTRDALSKALYAQLFDFLVTVINSAMRKEKIELCIGVLDIYGFEIFETNGFEQFCINFVNEKLQQIFVELTLKSEQEEYLEEGITWTPVKFFNNKLVCDLIESKNPPGIMSVLDDVCFTVHASEGSDRTLMEKLKAVIGGDSTYSKYFRGLATHFEIHHYAGKVHYETKHFCERNKDSLFDDIIQLMQSSQNEFIQSLFADMPTSSGRRGRGSTGSSKIKSQCQTLIDRIMACTPHYVRCLKPSETKEPLDWHDHRILPQISYLGLRENIQVRRAGFAFRRLFDKVIDRYDAIVPKEKMEQIDGDKASICQAIMETAQFSPEIWRIGNTKVFMKESDMITKLEHLRSDALYWFAVKIQSVVRGFLARQFCRKLREMIKASKIVTKAIRNYVEMKIFNYRLSVKQDLTIVKDYLVSENAKYGEDTSTSTEMTESRENDESVTAEEPKPLNFTHEENSDQVGFYFNETLQNTIGERSIFFTCQAKVFGKYRKMENHVIVLSLYNFYIVAEESTYHGLKYAVAHTIDYTELLGLSISILNTNFLVLQTSSFDLIIDTVHKDSLTAFFIAIVNVRKQIWLPFQKSDEISVNSESDQHVYLRFLIEGRREYSQPRVSNSGNEIAVVLPDPNEVVEVCQEEEQSYNVEDQTVQSEYQETLEDENIGQGQQDVEVNQDFHQTYEEQRTLVQKRESSFCLNVELGKCGGKVSCKGFDVIITESTSEYQSVSLEIFYEPPSSSYLCTGEILLSPFVVVACMPEEETELQLTVPFLRDVPDDTDTMAKWIRFYGSSSGDDAPMWQDIRTAEEMQTFMVEIRENYAKLHTQQNVTFCIVGSRNEPAVVYNYETGEGEQTYGEYNYTYEEYAAYYSTYGAENYGENYYGQNIDAENYVAENNDANNDNTDYFVGGNAESPTENDQSTDANVTFATASAGLENALQSPIPRPALGLSPPKVPSSQPPARPSRSPFEDMPVEKEGKKKTRLRKVWKSNKVKKKAKEK